MRYVPYHQLNGIPNIIVDGAPSLDTKLTLSHWPSSGTPSALKDDLSAQIVFRYLEQPSFHTSVEAVSNNHFDEDGLISLFTILNPQIARENKDLLIDVAAAGDFGTYKYADAARISFTIAAFSDETRSPLPARTFSRNYMDQTAALYREMLERLPDIISNVQAYRDFWSADEAELKNSEHAIETGLIQIHQTPKIDLAVVFIPEVLPRCHQLALHNATRCFRILLMHGRNYELKYRYETWVEYVSAKTMPRVDLTQLATQLSELEKGNVWEFDGVNEIVPSLHLLDSSESNVPPEKFVQHVTDFLHLASV
jgi:Family of unknown function (DUF6687)